MYPINRQVAVIKPKQAYLEWIKSLQDMVDELEIDDLQNDSTAILLPHFDDDTSSLKYIKSIYPKLFIIELESWSTDNRTWPKKRTWVLFCDWFQIELHSEVLDFGKDDIVKEEY
jgi:hypothetical protein